jgi:hypothetical protein
MRQYVLDEIASIDLTRIREYLNDKAKPAGLDGLWWVEMPPELRTEEQAEHAQCQPQRFAIDLGRTFLRFEFFIRSNRQLRCSCTCYATERQRAWIMAFADRLVEDLQLRT